MRKRGLNGRVKGMALVLAGASLWGLSGNAAQFLFAQNHMDASWLVSVRMIISGLLLLILSLVGKHRNTVIDVFKDKKDVVDLLIFAFTGMLGVQLTFFLCIEHGNAPTATLLQFLGPVIITIYFALKDKRLPKWTEGSAVIVALGGTFLLLTNGNMGQVAVSKAAVFWGLLSAAAVAVYTVFPVRLLQKWPSSVIVGWGMLIGGLGLSVWNHPWNVDISKWPESVWLVLGFVVLFGTLLPFLLYLDSLRYITATETSILGSAEPLVATLVSVVWLHTPFGFFQTIGGMLIVLTVFLLALPQKSKFSHSSNVKSEVS